jgi:hypothetical protein
MILKGKSRWTERLTVDIQDSLSFMGLSTHSISVRNQFLSQGLCSWFVLALFFYLASGENTGESLESRPKKVSTKSQSPL